jgi:hypothetical protein
MLLFSLMVLALNVLSSEPSGFNLAIFKISVLFFRKRTRNNYFPYLNLVNETFPFIFSNLNELSIMIILMLYIDRKIRLS